MLGPLIADGGDKNGCRMEIIRDADLAEADEDTLDRELAPEKLYELQLEQLFHAHVAQVVHA